MNSADSAGNNRDDSPLRPPPVRWGIVAAGISAAGAALRLGSIALFGSSADPGMAVTVATTGLAIAGLIGAGFGIAARPKSAGVLVLAAAACYFSVLAFDPNWDAIWIAPAVGCGVCLAAAILVKLPRSAQYVAVSLLVLFHFGGILSAITSPHPQPWLSLISWVAVFRPYLTFCYVNNAYQFYSPEPGPASLLWFCVTGQDGTIEWYKIPRKPEPGLDPLGIEYSRRLSLTEQMAQSTSPIMSPLAGQRRVNRFDIKRHPFLPEGAQYRLLLDRAQKLVASYVRRVAHEFGDGNVRSMKVYRVQHRIPNATELAMGWHPFDPASYDAYFLGEYDAAGKLLDSTDSVLYWVIPVYWVDDSDKPVNPALRPPADAARLENFLEYHAGSNPFAGWNTSPNSAGRK